MTVGGKAFRKSALCMLGACLLFAPGCGRNRGPATAAYLKAEREVVSAFLEGQQSQPPQPPPMLPTAADDEARRRYSDELTFYYSVLIKSLGRETQALAEAQDRMGAIEPEGADPEALRLIAGEEAVFAAGQAMIREASLVYNRKRAALVQFQPPNALDDRCMAGIEEWRVSAKAAGTEAYWMGPAWDEFGALTETTGLAPADRARVEEQTGRFRDSRDAARRAAAAFQSERIRILDTLNSRYLGIYPAR